MRKHQTTNAKRLRREIDINHTAKLANLTLTSQEKGIFAKQLDDVLVYISKLQEISTQKVEPIGHITGLVNVTRADEAVSSLKQEDTLANAPKVYNGFFQVEAIFEEE